MLKMSGKFSLRYAFELLLARASNGNLPKHWEVTKFDHRRSTVMG